VGRKGSVGAVHYCDKPFWPIDTVYYVRRLQPDDWRYLYYLLSYLNLGLLNAATGVPGLTRRDAHFMLGAFPLLDEQRRIAGLLNAAESAISTAKTELQATRLLKKALTQQLFTRGMPGQHSSFKQTKIGDLPSSWNVQALAGHCGGPECVKTGPFGAQLPPEAFDKKGMRFVNITDIGEGVLDFAEEIYISDNVAERLKESQLLSGDLVFSRVASVGRVAVIPEELAPMMMSGVFTGWGRL
jgi:type I restriction enzyme S subunit